MFFDATTIALGTGLQLVTMRQLLVCVPAAVLTNQAQDAAVIVSGLLTKHVFVIWTDSSCCGGEEVN